MEMKERIHVRSFHDFQVHEFTKCIREKRAHACFQIPFSHLRKNGGGGQWQYIFLNNIYYSLHTYLGITVTGELHSYVKLDFKKKNKAIFKEENKEHWSVLLQISD